MCCWNCWNFILFHLRMEASYALLFDYLFPSAPDQWITTSIRILWKFFLKDADAKPLSNQTESNFWQGSPGILFFFTFYFEIVSNLQKSCKTSSKNSNIYPLPRGSSVTIFSRLLYYFPLLAIYLLIYPHFFLNYLRVCCRYDAPLPLNTSIYVS